MFRTVLSAVSFPNKKRSVDLLLRSVGKIPRCFSERFPSRKEESPFLRSSGGCHNIREFLQNTHPSYLRFPGFYSSFHEGGVSEKSLLRRNGFRAVRISPLRGFAGQREASEKTPGNFFQRAQRGELPHNAAFFFPRFSGFPGKTRIRFPGAFRIPRRTPPVPEDRCSSPSIR